MMKVKKRHQKSYIHWMYFIAVCLLLFFILSCGSSRQGADLGEEDVNLDELLSEDEWGATGRDSEEAEVLRLLGITPEVKELEITEIKQEEKASSLPNEVTHLEQEIDEKDSNISNLRSQLLERESKISDLQSQVQSLERRRITSSQTNQTGPSGDFKSKYQYALSQYNSRDYQKAISDFSELLSIDANNSFSDNCQYWIGECYYGLGNYNQAIVEFEKVFSFPASNKGDDAQLKLGICYLKVGDRQQAQAEFERLLSNYPDSEYIALAQRYLTR